ncbi:hypothetical protein N9811_02215 [Bacteroidia bacterium]|nr:hypothetical protein [Bacteroidia bacterium]
MKLFLPSALLLLIFASCQKEDLRAPDFDITYQALETSETPNQMTGMITNVSSTPANTVSIRIDRYTDFNLVQDPLFIVIDKKLFHNDTAKFTFESSAQIKRVEISVVNVD